MTRSTAARARGVDAPPGDHRPRRIQRRLDGGQSGRGQQRGGVGLDLEAAAVPAPAGPVTRRNRGVSDLQRVAGTTQMQTAIDDQTTAHPDLTGHDVEQLRRAPARAVPGFRERGQVGVVADVHPDVAQSGAARAGR